MRDKTPGPRRSRIHVRHGGAIAVILAIGFTATFAGAGHADNQIADPGWVVAPATSTANLVDGQVFTVNVKSRTDVAVNEVDIRECRSGATYATAADVSPDAGNCPPRPVSTSADSLVTRGASNGLAFLARTADGANIQFLIGEGVVQWTNAKGNVSLSCDPKDPCALVVEVSAGPQPVFQTITLNFADPNPLGACGGSAPGALHSGGSDEMADAYALWTRADCVASHTGAPTLAAFSDERAAVSGFTTGLDDIAYTAAGYNSTVGVGTTPTAQQRPAVAIPIALNASVIAAGGGQHQLVNGIPLGDKTRYPDGSLALTAGEVGALLGGGEPWISRLDLSYSGAILNRNPALQGILYASDADVQAPSRTLASTYFMTRYLSAIAPTDFIDPTVSAAHAPECDTEPRDRESSVQRDHDVYRSADPAEGRVPRGGLCARRPGLGDDRSGIRACARHHAGLVAIRERIRGTDRGDDGRRSRG